LLVWAAGALYGAAYLKRGWVPHDEGTLGQTAERVLAGQLPHRDFDDVYTGGLTYVNAAAFRIFGETLLAPRIVLFLVFLAWVPAIYWIASRFGSPGASAAVTLAAVAFSIPNYSCAIPSWYNLFLATFGVVALLRYIESPSSGWLFVAGVCGGVSFLFKVSGLYFVAAGLLFLVFREQGPGRRERTRKLTAYSAFATLCLGMFVGVLFLVTRRELTFVAFLEFVAPGAALALLCVLRGLGKDSRTAGERFVDLFGTLLPFLAGVALPIALFLIPYVRGGAVADFVNGVFVLPFRRFDFAAQKPAGFSPNKLLAVITLGGLLLAGYLGRGRSLGLRVLVTVGLVAALLEARTHPKVFEAVWAPLALLIPLGVLAGAIVLWKQRGRLSFARQQQFMLVLAVLAVCTLIQLPFSVGIYFCYIAPLIPVVLLALYSTSEKMQRFLPAAVLLFYVAFLAFEITPAYIYVMGSFYQPNPQTAALALPRAGGLRVDPEEAAVYDELIPKVEEHAGGSPFIYAAPDCPEVYFLSGRRNPTRTLFDFFDDANGHTQRVLQTIESHNVNAIVIQTAPAFSDDMAPDLVSGLRQRFPHSDEIGKFELRWK
jgi:hypothetical protein